MPTTEELIAIARRNARRGPDITAREVGERQAREAPAHTHPPNGVTWWGLNPTIAVPVAETPQPTTSPCSIEDAEERVRYGHQRMDAAYADSVARPDTMTAQEAISVWGPRNRNPFRPTDSEFMEYQRLITEGPIERLLKKHPEVPILTGASKRRLPQPVLKMDFETLSDIKMRLSGTYVFIGQHLYYIRDIFQHQGDYLMELQGPGRRVFWTYYNRNTAIDLRGPEPQYITINGRAVFLLRPPLRQQRQGLSFDNLQCKAVGSSRITRFDIPEEFMTVFTGKTMQWIPQYDELLKHRVVAALRLSKRVAVYSQKQQTKMEFQGRFLGNMKDNTVELDRLDISRPWVVDAVREVGCRVGRV